jgi:hypothetical protein
MHQQVRVEFAVGGEVKGDMPAPQKNRVTNDQPGSLPRSEVLLAKTERAALPAQGATQLLMI